MDAYGNSKNMGSLTMKNLFNDSKPISGLSWATGGNIHLPRTANISNATNQLTRDGGIQNSVAGMKHSADDAKYYGFQEEKPKKPERRGRKKKRTDSDEQELPISNEDGSNTRLKNYESAAARTRNVTAEERERAITAAKAFEPVNPFCRVVLRPSYLYKGCIMYLPSCFAEKHLNGVSGFIKLQYSEKQWAVRCLYSGGRAKFRKGWYEFALENNIREGDVCVFELLDSRDIVLQVTIFRVLEHNGFINRP